MLSFKIPLSLSLLCALVNGEPPVPVYGVPFNNNQNYNTPSTGYGLPNNNYVGTNNNYNQLNTYSPSNGYSSPNNHHNYDDNGHDHSEPKSYEFGYAVKDDYTGNDYKRRETSDGNQVQGEYRVQLPDGRTQIVTYYADWKTGFHADVRYEGTANYPDTYKTYNQGGGYQGGVNGYQGGVGDYQGGVGGHQGGVGGYQGGVGGYHGGVSTPSNQYGVPNNQYGAPNTGFNPPSSSVTIKDFSGPGTPYNVGGGYGHGGNGHVPHVDITHNGLNTGYDSYANSGFGNKPKPSQAYGAP